MWKFVINLRRLLIGRNFQISGRYSSCSSSERSVFLKNFPYDWREFFYTLIYLVTHIKKRKGMMNQVLTLEDGSRIEVEINEGEVLEISAMKLSNVNLDDMLDPLIKASASMTNALKKISEETALESAAIKLGIKLGIEGGFIIAKSSAEANFEITLNLKIK